MITSLLLIASASTLALATPHNDAQQKPIQNSQPDVIHTLKLDTTLHYTIQPPTPNPASRIPPIHTMQDLQIYTTLNQQTATLALPTHANETGTLTFSPNPPFLSQNPFPPSSSLLEKDNIHWIHIPTPQTYASRIPLHTLSVRRGGAISMAVDTARLDVGSAFIEVPGGIWDVVVLATGVSGDGLGEGQVEVDCGRRGVFPDLVSGIRGEDEMEGDEGEDGEGELVVTPWQYVLEREGRCELLVRKAEGSGDGDEDGDVVVGLGWAALRGRRLVIDAVGRRMGIMD
ncbi:hypothetical protein T440DRAFT_478082 [Plenodomus tracheiphilus IPT5]|uniref:Peptidase A1 domain-containing protein n=1 Tax=Plenodomus tracheiphilus IPT5 TaxID=1408161 RepID=A0A6A7B960_9PLEO|nr:hypothetical protein T440DRAFT_478082 [Plenodomus tracheiphilus IPT5]